MKTPYSMCILLLYIEVYSIQLHYEDVMRGQHIIRLVLLIGNDWSLTVITTYRMNPG